MFTTLETIALNKLGYKVSEDGMEARYHSGSVANGYTATVFAKSAVLDYGQEPRRYYMRTFHDWAESGEPGDHDISGYDQFDPIGQVERLKEQERQNIKKHTAMINDVIDRAETEAERHRRYTLGYAMIARDEQAFRDKWDEEV